MKYSNDLKNDSPNRDALVFTQALQLGAGERSAYLKSACGGDRGLRQRVDALLNAHHQVGDYLEHPPQKIMLQAREALAGEKPGDHIGHYKLSEQIGEGGCGIVFMAEQEEPIRRRVALKVIKPGMDTKSVIARFEAERQALALMDHPNVAKIFDAGATESGRPYFVMELIRGVKITEYCDQNSLTTEERLKLFVQICQAIQHAHQKGIIHRDIKPSNILVTTTAEGAALPVVIDFGIAKATTNQQLTDKTLFTAFEMLIGTPAYMSPEQAALAGVDVDTRTDIYSLGVLLYELLTGSTPFDSGELLKAGLDEIRRVIREQEPIRPSSRLTKLTNADLTTVARCRRSEPPLLIRAVRGDLDWIVMKSLEKDRTRRYETANGLALDVQRFLANEPIAARPPSPLYKLQKTLLRNKLLFVGIGVIALLLVVSLIVVSTSLAKERRSRRVAETALQQAQIEKAKAQTASVKSRQVTQFLEDMLQGVGPSVALGQDTTMLRGILDQTAEHVGVEMTNQPAIEAELRSLIGRLYFEIGNYNRAEEMHRTALVLNRELFGAESPEAAASLNNLGLALDKESKSPEAESAHREALDIRRRSFGNENADVAASLNNLATVVRHQKRLAEAETLTREALEIRQTLFGADSLEVADTLHNLSVVLGDEGKRAECETTALEMLAMRRRLLGNEHLLVAAALADAAWAASGSGKLDEAEALYRKALAMRVKILGEGHPDSLATFHNLGLTLAAEGKWSEAETVQREALAGWRKRAGNEDPNTLHVLCDLGLSLKGQGKLSEAETAFREASVAWRKRAGDHDPQTLYTLRDLASVLEGEGKLSEAEIADREALAGWRQLAGNEDPQTTYTLRLLGLVLETENKWPEAETTFREALAVSRKKPAGNQDPEALVDVERLVRVLVVQNKLGEAEQALGEVLTPSFAGQPSSTNLLIQRINLMGRRGRWQEATADAALALEFQPSDHYRYHTLAGLLVMTQKRPEYERLCQRFLTQFADTSNPYIAERVVDDCLLLPDSEVDLGLVDKLADTAIKRGSGYGDMPYFQACKAMSNYRLGHFREAIEGAKEVVTNSLGEAPAPAKAKACAVLAMAHWRLGKKDAAREMLAKGETLMPGILSGREPVDLGELWLAWLFAWIQLDEATSLIQAGPTNISDIQIHSSTHE